MRDVRGWGSHPAKWRHTPEKNYGDRGARWEVCAQPVPDVSPLLSYGTHDESASVQLYSDAYDVEHSPGSRRWQSSEQTRRRSGIKLEISPECV